MGNSPTPGRGTNPTNDENEDESPTDRPGLDDFQDPPEMDEEDNTEDRTIGGGGGSGMTVQAGSSSIVTQDEEPEDDAETEEPDEEESGTDTELRGVEDETEQEDSEETDSDVVEILQIVDPLSYSSWDMQPVMQRVAEQYRGQIDLRFVPAPVRDIDDEIPESRNGMPLDDSFYSDPPATTELVNRAWIAAIKQRRGYDYLRRLWIDTLARGRNLDDESRLVEIADDMGLNIARFKTGMDNADLPTWNVGDLPVTRIKTDVPARVEGYMRYTEFGTKLAPEGIKSEPPRDLPEFVHTYGPVETVEVKEVYDFDSLADAEAELSGTAGVSRRDIGTGTFWE